VSAVGTSRQFAAAQHFGRFQSEADIHCSAPETKRRALGASGGSREFACRASGSTVERPCRHLPMHFPILFSGKEEIT